ncbi:MAG: PAS domain S-box protein, partial [Cyclobacteriaceae bacterium]
PYKSSVESIYTELSKLDSLFLDEITQKQRGDSLRLLIDKQYRIITTILENEEESKRFIDRYEINLLIVGRENMDRIRKICGRMTQYENDVLKARLTQEYDLKSIAPFTLLLSGFVVLGVAGFLFVRIIDELKRRRKTERELNIKIEELDQKEKRYRSLFERSIDPIFLADDKFNMVDANSSLQNLFGYSYEQACNLDLEELFIDKSEFTSFKEKLDKDNHVRDFEVTLKDKNNKKLISLVNCVRIDDTTSPVYYQGIIHDITMRKKVERELIQAEKLSTTGKIARTIAHEVRNPLTNLNLAMDQLKEEFTANENTKVYTDILDRNLNRIEELISELLRSSRPKELQLLETPLEVVLNETVDLIKDRINLNEMKLINDIPSTLPNVLVDKELVKIALVNIMVNAIEAMEHGAGVLRISVEQDENEVMLTIADNGKGIPDGEVEKLFDPFYSAKQGGMGLGLTSTQNILNSHKIEIEVQSELEKGTSFHITFTAII